MFTDSCNSIKASACDCIANIGAEVFDLLPVSGDCGVGGGAFTDSGNLIRASTPGVFDLLLVRGLSGGGGTFTVSCNLIRASTPGVFDLLLVRGLSGGELLQSAITPSGPAAV